MEPLDILPCLAVAWSRRLTGVIGLGIWIRRWETLGESQCFFRLVFKDHAWGYLNTYLWVSLFSLS